MIRAPWWLQPVTLLLLTLGFVLQGVILIKARLKQKELEERFQKLPGQMSPTLPSRGAFLSIPDLEWTTPFRDSGRGDALSRFQAAMRFCATAEACLQAIGECQEKPLMDPAGMIAEKQSTPERRRNSDAN